MHHEKVSMDLRRTFSILRGDLIGAYTLWRRSLALVFTAAPRQALSMGVLMAPQAGLPVGTLWASRGVVNAAVRAAGLGGAAAGAAGLPLAVWIAVAVGLIVAQQVLSPLLQAAQDAAWRASRIPYSPTTWP